MIWLKRALPLFVLIAAWFGYAFIRDTLRSHRTAEDTRHALITAQVWVASATFRANPQAFIAYRDSLLKANNMSLDQMFRYLRTYEKDPARQLFFSQEVGHYVDSLTKPLIPGKPQALSERQPATPPPSVKTPTDSLATGIPRDTARKVIK